MSGQFSTAKPIYLQLVQRICRQIVRGEVRPGEKLPSVRDMAVQFGVNPNTIQRVNMELERMGVIESRRGQGMFVTENHSRLALMKTEMREELVVQFARDMSHLGYCPEEIAAALTEYLNRSPSDAEETEGGGNDES